MRLEAAIAVRHLLARKRQSLVSVAGIILGVAFFCAIAAMMRGTENDFIKRLVDNSPHITIYDDFRTARQQPLFEQYKTGAVELKNVKPLPENRGIRGYQQALDFLSAYPGVRASPVLAGQGLVNFSGRDFGITLNGMIPEQINDVTTISSYMIEGAVDDLIVSPDGIIIGAELQRKLSLHMGNVITITAPGGQVRAFKIVGVFRTGRAGYDESQTFLHIKRVQALLNRPDRANTIIVKVPDPYSAFRIAAEVEQRLGYKAVSWVEASQDIMNTLAVRNTIMYSVVSAVLVVAAFGIYNVISTVVMEKQRDIAILKALGYTARQIKKIFLIQGACLGVFGCGVGIPLGMLLMLGLGQVTLKPPGSTEPVNLPLDWGASQFVVAAVFALSAALLAAYLPARKAAKVQPVDILRGGA